MKHSFTRSLLLVILLTGVMGVTAIAQEVVDLAPALAINRAAKKVNPTYPPVAQQLRLKGTLDVDITVNPEGDVEQAAVARGNAIFSQNALAAVKQWKFQPLQKDGKAVSFKTTIPFNFTGN